MNKHLYWAALLGLSSACVVAQEGPAPASLPQPAAVIVDEAVQAPAQTEIEIVKSAELGIDNAHLYVTEQADAYVRERKAAYQRQGRGQEVFLQYGVADVSRQPTSPDWADARSIAYLQAQTKAREALIKQLYISISSDVARESFRTNQGPEFTPEELQNSGKLESMLDKVVAVADASLDKKPHSCFQYLLTFFCTHKSSRLISRFK